MTTPEDQAIIDAALAKQRWTTTVQATNGVLAPGNLKSLDNWRAFIHQLTPVVVTALISVALITENQATLWVPLFFAIIDPLLSALNAQDKMRQIIYGVLGLAQSGGILTALLVGGNEPYIPLAAAGVTVISSFLGRFYTPTTTMVPAA